MLPTEEEKTKIQEAQMQLPDLPLAHAEQFLLTLATINELSPRLNLWAFKLDYDANEKEAAESLSDLKHTVDQIKRSGSLKKILATLLAIGNFLNGIKVFNVMFNCLFFNNCYTAVGNHEVFNANQSKS